MWNDHNAEQLGSEEMLAAHLDTTLRKGTVVGENGNIGTALAEASEVIEATYSFPFLAHAPMEPLDGFLTWTPTAALARFGSQIPSQDRGLIANVLGLAEEDVQIDVMLAGGSFGRRASLYGTLATELAETAKAIGPGRPIKLVSTREDDIQGGYYRPMAVHRLRGAVRDGVITAWSNTVAAQSFTKGTAWEEFLWKDGVDPVVAEGSADPPYRFENFSCDIHMMSSLVTTCAFRSVGHTQSCYAVECFLDQLLEIAGKDPVEGRLELLGDKPRVAGVLRAAAKAADWQGRGPVGGRAWGVAVVEVFGTAVANIAEVSLGADGQPKVHKIWCAVDCGIAVNPDVIRAQMEGGIGFGLGHALYAEIPIVSGRVTVDNFDLYRSITLAEMPAVEVVIIKSSEPSTGVGEPGVPAAAPAVANALSRLSGARPSRLPMVRS